MKVEAFTFEFDTETQKFGAWCFMDGQEKMVYGNTAAELFSNISHAPESGGWKDLERE